MSERLSVITPTERAGAALKAAYEFIKAPNDPSFEALDSSHRILALAAAMVAADPLVRALQDIRAMETPGANATVKRMASRAAQAIEARRAETLGSVHESAVGSADAPNPHPSGTSHG